MIIEIIVIHHKLEMEEIKWRLVNNMDVYLQPLVDELNELWDGINLYDVSRTIAT